MKTTISQFLTSEISTETPQTSNPIAFEPKKDAIDVLFDKNPIAFLLISFLTIFISWALVWEFFLIGNL